MSIHVTDFNWEKGKNDLKYIELLEKTLKNEQAITGKAVAKIRQLTEELQSYKQGNCTNDCEHFDNAVAYGYEKGIDDFVDKLKTKCDGMIKDKWNSNVAPISWAEAYADFKDDIDGIAEQLKAGGENA